MNTEVINQQTYNHPELERLYESIKQREMIAADIQAKEAAIKGQPKALREHITRFLTPLAARIQSALDLNSQLHLPVSSVASAADVRAQSKAQLLNLSVEASDLKEKREVLKHVIQELRLKMPWYFPTWLYLTIAALFGLSEGALVLTVAAEMFPSWAAVLMAMVTAVACVWGVRMGAEHICLGKTKKARLKRKGLIISLGLLAAIALGLWRANHFSAATHLAASVALENESPIAPGDFSVWPFSLLSFIFFIIALSFEIWSWRSDQQKKVQREYEQKNRLLKDINEALEKLEGKMTAVASEGKQVSACVATQQEYAKAFEQRLLTLANEIKALYESVNVKYRTDGVCPDFFGRSFDFDFKLYFNELFNAKKCQQ